MSLHTSNNTIDNKVPQYNSKDTKHDAELDDMEEEAKQIAEEAKQIDEEKLKFIENHYKLGSLSAGFIDGSFWGVGLMALDHIWPNKSARPNSNSLWLLVGCSIGAITCLDHYCKYNKTITKDRSNSKRIAHQHEMIRLDTTAAMTLAAISGVSIAGSMIVNKLFRDTNNVITA